MSFNQALRDCLLHCVRDEDGLIIGYRLEYEGKYYDKIPTIDILPLLDLDRLIVKRRGK